MGCGAVGRGPTVGGPSPPRTKAPAVPEDTQGAGRTAVAAYYDFNGSTYGSEFIEVRKGDLLVRGHHPYEKNGWVYAAVLAATWSDGDSWALPRLNCHGWVPEWLLEPPLEAKALPHPSGALRAAGSLAPACSCASDRPLPPDAPRGTASRAEPAAKPAPPMPPQRPPSAAAPQPPATAPTPLSPQPPAAVAPEPPATSPALLHGAQLLSLPGAMVADAPLGATLPLAPLGADGAVLDLTGEAEAVLDLTCDKEAPCEYAAAWLSACRELSPAAPCSEVCSTRSSWSGFDGAPVAGGTPDWQPQVPWTPGRKEEALAGAAPRSPRASAVHEVLQRLGQEAGDAVSREWCREWWLRILRSPDVNVQLLGVEASPAAAGGDCAAVVRAELAELARNGEALVRRASLRSLVLVSPRGDTGVIQALAGALEDPVVEVRASAMEMLPKVADKGDSALLAAVAVRLEHPLSFVRWSAIQVLPRLAEAGDPVLVAAVSARLKSSEAHARQAAVELLPTVSHHDDQSVLAAIAHLLADEDAGVRRAAVQAMTRLPRLRDERLPKLLSGILDHPDERVQWAAIEAMMQAAPEPDEFLMTAVARWLRDRTRAVRKSAEPAELDAPTRPMLM